MTEDETKLPPVVGVYPLKGNFLVGDLVVDLTAKGAGWPDVEGVVVEIDGSQVKVKYESGSERWKMHTNLERREPNVN